MKFLKIFLIILISFTIKVNAQNNNSEIIDITAKVMSRSDNKPVAFATVVNTKKGTAVLTDSLGYFHFTILKSDELKITAIGFEKKIISFNDSLFNKLKIYNIYLQQKTYNLDKVDIYEARWKDFEYEFANIDIVTNETQEKIQNWFQSIISTRELALITSAAAIGIPINYKTSKEKKRLEVAEMEQQDKQKELVDKKFNEKLVSEITGLKPQNVKDFMEYCNFTPQFILESTEYDLITEIKKRYDVYKKQNSVNFR